MTTVNEPQIMVMPDLTQEPPCGAIWTTGAKRIRCHFPATWRAKAHDEVDTHKDYTLLLCDRCVALAKIKGPCDDCGAIIIYDLQRL